MLGAVGVDDGERLVRPVGPTEQPGPQAGVVEGRGQQRGPFEALQRFLVAVHVVEEPGALAEHPAELTAERQRPVQLG